MAKHQTEADYDRRLSALARQAFSSHEIVKRDARRWVIMQRRPDGRFYGFHAAEIILASFGHVIVHGDVDACGFAGYYGGEGEKDPIAPLRWVARSRGDMGYLATKAAHFMGKGAVERDDDRVARADVLRHAQQCRDGADVVTEKGRERHRRRMNVFREALALLDDNSGAVPLVRALLAEKLHELDAWEWDIGSVTDARVFYAVAACARLVELLDAEAATAKAGGEEREAAK